MQPRITRSFTFERGGGGRQVNGQFMDCTPFRFKTQMDEFERWKSGGWQHPVHVHFEEFRILRRNGVDTKAGDVNFCRKDVLRLEFGETAEVLLRFRDMKAAIRSTVTTPSTRTIR